MKARTSRNFPVYAAGHLWSVNAVKLTELPDGTQAISQEELARIHRGIANAVCGAGDVLTIEELEFLCDVTDTSFTDVAVFLDLNKSTITMWRKKGQVPSRMASNTLKRWFWFQIFGDELAGESLPLSGFQNDEGFLKVASQRAIRLKATMPVELKRAS